MNTDELDYALMRVERRVLGIQAKLHQWASDDPHCRFDDLYNLVCDPGFLLVAWDRVRNNRGARTAGVDGDTAHHIEAGHGVEGFLADLDLTGLKIRVSRGEHVHVIYLDTFTLELVTAWLAHRQRRWPTSPNSHLLITSQTAHHPAQPPLSYCGLRAAFDKIGILPKQLWSDRVLHEAKHTADPVHLVGLFGIHPHTAVKYVNAAHPDKALPRIR